MRKAAAKYATNEARLMSSFLSIMSYPALETRIVALSSLGLS